MGAGGKLKSFIIPADKNISPATMRKMLSMRPVHGERDVSKMDMVPPSVATNRIACEDGAAHAGSVGHFDDIFPIRPYLRSCHQRRLSRRSGSACVNLATRRTRGFFSDSSRQAPVSTVRAIGFSASVFPSSDEWPATPAGCRSIRSKRCSTNRGTLADAYARASSSERAAIFRAYLRNTARINNWDLVDVSAPHVVGVHLATRSRRRLDTLARSKSVWERRIAIIATQHFIRNGEFDDTLRIARLLIHDSHDLIHKAVGWMLREVGNRDRAALSTFLARHAHEMPRTMLRYAIEKLPPSERARFMAARRAGVIER
jgi:hypothetical protein